MKYIYVLYDCDSAKSKSSMDALHPICVTTRKTHLLSVLEKEVKENEEEAKAWREYGKDCSQLECIKRYSVLSPYSMVAELNDILTYYCVMLFTD